MITEQSAEISELGLSLYKVYTVDCTGQMIAVSIGSNRLTSSVYSAAETKRKFWP